MNYLVPHDHYRRTMERKNHALIRGFLNPGECCRWDGEVGPDVLISFVDKLTEQLSGE